jgi:flagellar biosynthesis/type III secretory pathway protein FliH
MALIYHERSEFEQPSLRRVIESSVQTDEHREEVSTMGRTIAEALRAEGLTVGRAEGLTEGRAEGLTEGRAEGLTEGRTEGLSEGRAQGQVLALTRTLIHQLSKRFGTISEDVASRIQATSDIQQLDTWLDRVITAQSLGEVGIC